MKNNSLINRSQSNLFVGSSFYHIMYVLTYLLFAHFLYNYLSNDLLKFLLHPIKIIVNGMTGVPFNYFSEYGYVQVDGLITINKTCSGFIFLNVLIAIAYIATRTVDFKKNTPFKNFYLSLLTVFSAYFICLLSNSSRIILGLKMQLFSINHSWFPNNIAHEVMGVLYFFIFSILFFLLIQKIRLSWNN